MLGRQRHAAEGLDLGWIGVVLRRAGIVEETGLGDPVAGIIWLVRRLARFGSGIEAGQVLLSGSFIRPIEAPQGSLFEADFGRFGHVTLQF